MLQEGTILKAGQDGAAGTKRGCITPTTVLASFHREKPMIREVKGFAQSHTASKRGGWD